MDDGRDKLTVDGALCDLISVTVAFHAGLSSEQVTMKTECREALVRAEAAGVRWSLCSKRLQCDLLSLYISYM